MIITIKRYHFDCIRCGYPWTSSNEHPDKCPYCKTSLWDKPIGENEPGPKRKKVGLSK